MDRKQMIQIYKRLDRQIEKVIDDVIKILNAYGDNYPLQTEAFQTIFVHLDSCEKILQVLRDRGLL